MLECLVAALGLGVERVAWHAQRSAAVFFSMMWGLRSSGMPGLALSRERHRHQLSQLQGPFADSPHA